MSSIYLVHSSLPKMEISITYTLPYHLVRTLPTFTVPRRQSPLKGLPSCMLHHPKRRLCNILRAEPQLGLCRARSTKLPEMYLFLWGINTNQYSCRHNHTRVERIDWLATVPESPPPLFPCPGPVHLLFFPQAFPSISH